MAKIRAKDGERKPMSSCLLSVYHGRWLSSSQTSMLLKFFTMFVSIFPFSNKRKYKLQKIFEFGVHKLNK